MSAPLFAAFALMTAMAIMAVLWPLARRPVLRSARAADLAVYRDQLAEIARDKASGRLPAGEAEAARVEVARRILAVDRAAREPGESVSDIPHVASTRPAQESTSGESASEESASEEGATEVRALRLHRRVIAILALLLLPAAAVGLYAHLGTPSLPGAPLAQRLAAPPDRSDVAILVRKVEEHLARNPNDGQGYEVIAPIYLRLGRADDAARAYRQAIALLGPTAERQASLGEALTIGANEIVTADAAEAFKAAVALDPSNAKAAFFLGVAAEQDGRRKDAGAIYSGIIARGPADAPWIPMVRAALERVAPKSETPEGGASTASGPGPSAADVEAAASMSNSDRAAMIRSMVERLETRLQSEPKDLEGWLRLSRSFMVLGQKERAAAALKSARGVFANDQEALVRIQAAEKDLVPGG